MTFGATVYLVRHGETDHNRANIFQGTNDIPLNARGRAQAVRLAQVLAPVRFHAAYTSPLVRARDTAAAIVEGTATSLSSVHALHELSYGHWQGITAAERETADAALVRQWRTAPWNVRFPGGETLAEAESRVLSVVKPMLARHHNETVLISAHGHVNRLILTYFLAIPRAAFWDIKQPNGCCYQVTLGADGANALNVIVGDDQSHSRKMVDGNSAIIRT